MLFSIESEDPRVPAGAHGSVENLRRWIPSVQGIGTTTVVLNDFINRICTNIKINPIPDTDDNRILVWDNLTSQHSAYVHQTVMGCTGNRFSIVACPQYHLKIAPIYYKIYDLTANVTNLESAEWDMAQLEQELGSSTHKIRPFDSNFWRCGYKWTLDANGNMFYQQ